MSLGSSQFQASTVLKTATVSAFDASIGGLDIGTNCRYARGRSNPRPIEWAPPAPQQAFCTCFHASICIDMHSPRGGALHHNSKLEVTLGMPGRGTPTPSLWQSGALIYLIHPPAIL
jgi:hypothetical protein